MSDKSKNIKKTDGRGGARKNAGRPPGAANKASVARQAAIAASGLTPLDYMLAMLRDESMPSENRKWAAEKAAPYVHPRLAAIEMSGALNISHEQALDELK